MLATNFVYCDIWRIRLDSRTMFKIREWERFQFGIDYQHHQVWSNQDSLIDHIMNLPLLQHKKILERTIPDVLKLSIARRIENKLFSKVWILREGWCAFSLRIWISVGFQISFLVGLREMGEIKTLFAAEVCCPIWRVYHCYKVIIAGSKLNLWWHNINHLIQNKFIVENNIIIPRFKILCEQMRCRMFSND